MGGRVGQKDLLMNISKMGIITDTYSPAIFPGKYSLGIFPGNVACRLVTLPGAPGPWPKREDLRAIPLGMLGKQRGASADSAT